MHDDAAGDGEVAQAEGKLGRVDRAGFPLDHADIGGGGTGTAVDVVGAVSGRKRSAPAASVKATA